MRVYDSILQGLKEAVAYAEGQCPEANVHHCSIQPFPTFDVREIKEVRSNLGVTQAVFASLLGISVKTVEAWEQGMRKPSGSACRLLQLFQENPNIASNLITESN